MSLATVHSKGSNESIRAVARDDVYWIGFNDIDEEGKWKWFDSSPVDYTNWGNGQPNSWNGNNEDCAAIGFSGWDEWIDAPCD